LTPFASIIIVNQLVNDSSKQLDAIFAALADATRRGILTQLARRGTVTIGELAEPYSISAPAISKHIRVLEEAGLIEREIDGRLHRCRLTASHLEDVARWIDRTRGFWESQFDSLARHLERKRKQTP
jgi:DNA-binding transcriptional ArsR family regulator